MFANEYDVHTWEDLFNGRMAPAGPEAGDLPNLARAARALAALMEWTNSCSDGWAYWPKPQRAATQLKTLLRAGADRDRQGDDTDATAAEVAKALTPVKSFLTRQDADWREVLNGALAEPEVSG